MKKFIGLILVAGIVSLSFAQKTPDDSSLQSLVDTERAFSKMSEEKGIRPAFMAFIADDGILFRPTAVKGKQWMTEHPLPASEKRPWLSWQPTVAGISSAGDMGYTTGPWEYKDDIHDAKPNAFGNFITVWKKQADGTWKFAVDLGISNPEPTQAVVPWRLPRRYKEQSPQRGGFQVESQRAALLVREREFSSASATHGARTAFMSYAAPEVRVFREGKFPFVGKDSAAAAMPAGPKVWTWEPTFADMSQSGDLGYSYGSYRLAGNEATKKTPQTGNYLRIWQKQNGTWKVLIDVANPLPEAKN